MENVIQPDNFIKYLNSNLDDEVMGFLNHLNEKLDLFIFSGIIRDFALGYLGPLRDIDLVVKDKFHELEDIIKDLKFIKYKKNSFGGYKLEVNNVSIDIWDIKNTWAFKENKINKTTFSENDLTKSCFFNFSSIVFNYKNSVFINTKNFDDFLERRILDIVLEENPYPELCIINTFYYQEKFELEISENLEKYIVRNFSEIEKNRFNKIQFKHFNEIVFSYSSLENKINKFTKKVKAETI